MAKNEMGTRPTNMKMGAFELTEGMTSEMMMPIFFNDKALREPSIRLYQLNTKGTRYYYYFNTEGRAVFMPSVTTVLRKTMPENTFLTDWKIGMGKDKAEAYTLERANYGTFMHAQIEKLIINRSYNLDELKTELAKYIEREQLPTDFINYAESLKKDILSFAQFMWDYDIQPYAVEISLFSKYGFAGMIDLVANIRTRPRSEEIKVREKCDGDASKLAIIETKFSERQNVIIDFKSGRKGFYEEHEIQLGMYRMLWEGWFSEIKIGGLFNWSPKDWKKSPTYNFVEQTDKPSLAKIPLLLDLYALEDDEEKEVTVVGGTIDMASDNPTEACYSKIALEDLVKVKEPTDEAFDKMMGNPMGTIDDLLNATKNEGANN